MAELWLSMVEGLQVPVMPLLDVVGRAGAAAAAQMVRDVPKSNVGVMLGLTVTTKLAGRAH